MCESFSASVLTLCRACACNEQTSSPDIKSFEAHYSNKHPKAAFDKEAFVKHAEAARAAVLEEQAKLVNGSHHKKK